MGLLTYVFTNNMYLPSWVQAVFKTMSFEPMFSNFGNFLAFLGKILATFAKYYGLKICPWQLCSIHLFMLQVVWEKKRFRNAFRHDLRFHMIGCRNSEYLVSFEMFNVVYSRPEEVSFNEIIICLVSWTRMNQ